LRVARCGIRQPRQAGRQAGSGGRLENPPARGIVGKVSVVLLGIVVCHLFS
jgi:hypothetical protein